MEGCQGGECLIGQRKHTKYSKLSQNIRKVVPKTPARETIAQCGWEQEKLTINGIICLILHRKEHISIIRKHITQGHHRILTVPTYDMMVFGKTAGQIATDYLFAPSVKSRELLYLQSRGFALRVTLIGTITFLLTIQIESSFLKATNGLE